MQPETPITPNSVPPQEPALSTTPAAPPQGKKTVVIVSIVVVVLIVIAAATAAFILSMSPSSDMQKQVNNDERQTASSGSTKAQTEDEKRRTDIHRISSQLESYYAENGGYPSLANLNNPAWRTANDVNLENLTRAINLSATTPKAVGDAYSYDNLSPTGCVSPTNDQGAPNTGTFCETYRLTAVLGGEGGTYVKSSVD